MGRAAYEPLAGSRSRMDRILAMAAVSTALCGAAYLSVGFVNGRSVGIDWCWIPLSRVGELHGPAGVT